ncbi:MAG: hypothetical protein JSV91_08660 [Phycisphaerales bacterium]|nr:MAG: hypothetical protein JSV91_08660 [Phycisphaerales bacterium]
MARAHSPIDFVRHHPLCPKCKYDLVATVAEGRNICPECGYEFETGELRHAVLPDDWTIWRGLRRAALHLVLRSSVCLAVWTGLLWAVTALAAWISSGRPWFVVLSSYVVALLILMITAGGIGRALARGMEEKAGVVSILVAALVTVFACVVVAAGTLIVNILSSGGGTGLWGMAVVSGGLALVVIVKTHFFEDY